MKHGLALVIYQGLTRSLAEHGRHSVLGLAPNRGKMAVARSGSSGGGAGRLRFGPPNDVHARIKAGVEADVSPLYTNRLRREVFTNG